MSLHCNYVTHQNRWRRVFWLAPFLSLSFHLFALILSLFLSISLVLFSLSSSFFLTHPLIPISQPNRSGKLTGYLFSISNIDQWALLKPHPYNKPPPSPTISPPPYVSPLSSWASLSCNSAQSETGSLISSDKAISCCLSRWKLFFL